LKDRRPINKIERDLHDAAGRIREEANAARERVREETDRVREEAHAAVKRVESEAPRKAIHLASIVIPLGILFFPTHISRRVLMVFALALLVTDLVKIHQPKLRNYFTHFFGHLIRRHERTDVTASTYMLVSALMATYLFDREVAAASMIFLIIGDFLAAMVGKAVGRTPLFGKTVEGFLAGFVSSFLVAWAIIPSLGVLDLLVAAFVGSVVEVLPIPVDDNFRIPLVSGLVLQLLR
jgi:dolichol kinase